MKFCSGAISRPSLNTFSAPEREWRKWQTRKTVFVLLGAGNLALEVSPGPPHGNAQVTYVAGDGPVEQFPDLVENAFQHGESRNI
jgi:hypothetical protein